MCEIRVVMVQDDKEELIMENVTKLEVTAAGVAITSLFGGAKEVEQSVVRSIDFVAGKVFLAKHSG